MFPFLRDADLFFAVLFLKLTNKQTSITKTANTEPSCWAAGVRVAACVTTDV